MAKVTAARIVALNIMRAIRSGELADRAFVHQVEQVPARDRAWLHELLYGTLRLRGRIDHILGGFVKKGITKLDDDVLDILRLGAYQLLEMHSVPAYAAVSQSVELTKTTHKSASGFVNGVLQSLRRNQDKLEVDRRHWSSHPDWLLDRWIARFGLEDALALAESNNRRPELFIRPVGIDLASALTRLNAQGVNAEEVAADAIRITSDKTVLDILSIIPAIVQDPAATQVARYANLDGVIADLCAAPGGKAIALADRLTNGYVVASDISISRMQRISENVKRIGNLPVHTVVADARNPVVKSVDGVLLDAPCTGTGTFRRHPDGKWRIQPSDLAALADLQSDLLESAAQIVRAGGVLVYSTCSIEPEENELQIERFLQRHPEFKMTAAPLVMLPHKQGFDGAFAARMQKAS